MDAWMEYDAMAVDIFQPPPAYPYPFGSASLHWLCEASDATLRRLSLPRLRDQAVSVDGVFEYFRGQYMALHHVVEHQGMTPYLEEQLTRTARSLRRIKEQQRRLRALLDAAPQPRQVVCN